MPSSPMKWPALAVSGLLLAGGVWAIGTAALDFLRGGPTGATLPSQTLNIGEEIMSVAHAKSQVQHASQSNFRSLVLQADRPVLVDFYTDWCGPCQRLAPVLQELAAEVPGARIVKVNVDENPGLAAEYGVQSIPSLKVFQNGRIVAETVGLASKAQLRTMLGADSARL